MDTDTSGGNGRRALGCAALVLGLMLAYLVSGLCLFYAAGADIALLGSGDERFKAIDSLASTSAGLTLLCWCLASVTLLLCSLAVVVSSPEISRRLRPWAAVAGIITGILLAADVLVMVAARYLASSI